MKSVEAIQYPDKLVISTRNQIDDYTWYTTDDITLLPPNASKLEIGNYILAHLNASKRQESLVTDFKKIRESYRKILKKKSEKEVIQNAKYVSVFLDRSVIRFEPKKTRLSKLTFYNLPERIIEIDINSDSVTIAEKLKESWNNCILTD